MFYLIFGCVKSVQTEVKTPFQRNRLNSQNNMDSATNPFNPPLTIDLIRKLKRPVSVPTHLEYNSGQKFQGSLLEDWLMLSLDEYLQQTASAQQSSKIWSQMASDSINTKSDDVIVDEQIISYQVAKSEHSLPGDDCL